MFLQGDLQAVFDALFSVGAIEPVLKMNWSNMTEKMEKNPNQVRRACNQVNACHGNRHQLVQKLSEMDNELVNYIALEVAREFCEYQERTNLQ